MTSSNKQVYLANFVEQAIQMCSDILLVVPNDTDFLKAKTYIQAIAKVNKKMLVTNWYENVSKPYKNQILNGNLNFALQNDFATDVDNNSSSTDESQYFTNIINKVKLITNELSDENVAKLIKYMQNLTNLSILYHN
jgi:hypothetical protein